MNYAANGKQGSANACNENGLLVMQQNEKSASDDDRPLDSCSNRPVTLTLRS